MINIRKRGSVYQYQFEAEPIDGKRKRFKTKAKAYEYGLWAYEEYNNGGIKRES